MSRLSNLGLRTAGDGGVDDAGYAAGSWTGTGRAASGLRW
jgi:hypothetical protein